MKWKLKTLPCPLYHIIMDRLIAVSHAEFGLHIIPQGDVEREGGIVADTAWKSIFCSLSQCSGFIGQQQGAATFHHHRVRPDQSQRDVVRCGRQHTTGTTLSTFLSAYRPMFSLTAVLQQPIGVPQVETIATDIGRRPLLHLSLP